jgi:hypothetical protein
MGRVETMKYFRRTFLFAAVVLAMSAAMISQVGLAAPAGDETGPIAFVNVNVIPMDSERILEQQTVIVRDGRILELGAADKISVPNDALRIDGRGKYLLPGLTDMHVHLKSPHEFPLYLANGITSVFNLWGRPAHLLWRDRIARSEMIGPTLYTCGPIIFHADTVDEARQIVEEQSKAGYDSIKIYNDVSKEAYPVLVETARRHHMLVVGHIPRAVGLEGVLEAHQAIAHLEEYIYTFFKDNVDDESRIPAAVAATRAADVPVTLTLVNFDHILRQAEDLPSFLKRPELKYLAPWVRDSWGPGRNFYQPRFKTVEQQKYLRKALAFQKTLTRELNRAGVKLFVGTDAMNPGVVPGFSVHEEMRLLVESGFTPFEAIRAATRFPAEFLDPAGGFGSVAAGKRADLILLNGNPLESLTNLTRRGGVMVRGRWLPESELEQMIAAVAAEYARDEKFVRSHLESDRQPAIRYLAENDPFNNLAIAAVSDLIIDKGFDQFKKIHDAMKRDAPGAFLSQEWFVDDVGADLLERGRRNEAIAVFQLNTELYPQSANTNAIEALKKLAPP